MGSFSIWHWIIFALFLLVIYGVYRLARRPRTSVGPSHLGPVGVGGWLLLLVAGLTVLGPLMNAGRINADLHSAESQYPHLATMASWQTYKAATWLTFFGMSAVSIWAGYGLAKGREWSVVRRAKISLWIVGPLATIVLAVMLPAMIFGGINLDPELVGSFIGSALVAAIWTMYLSKSRRVRATYIRGDEWQKSRDSYQDRATSASERAVADPIAAQSTTVATTIDDKLRELRKLYDEGLISHEIYLERQRLLLDGKALR
jgi:hypothetical protein